MKLDLHKTPRTFIASRKHDQITISDYGKISLDSDEMVSFVNDQGKELDFSAKDWGFYATPSVNSRLKSQGFKTALVRNEFGQIYIMVVDVSKMVIFEKYCSDEKQEILEWLDERPLNDG